MAVAALHVRKSLVVLMVFLLGAIVVLLGRISGFRFVDGPQLTNDQLNCKRKRCSSQRAGQYMIETGTNWQSVV